MQTIQTQRHLLPPAISTLDSLDSLDTPVTSPTAHQPGLPAWLGRRLSWTTAPGRSRHDNAFGSLGSLGTAVRTIQTNRIFCQVGYAGQQEPQAVPG